jgi:mRNA-degrading endonuclease YafQ of YafQ-DinJ toxin-antitoxin module
MYEKLSHSEQDLTDKKLKLLAENPCHPSLRTKKHWKSECFESSVNMNIRIIWQYKSDSLILLLLVGRHDIL